MQGPSLDIVDTHAHVISDDLERYPVAPLHGRRTDWSSERPVSYERFAAMTLEAGVGQVVLVHSSTTYGHDNTYAADSAERDPSRFVPVGSCDPFAPDAPERMAYWVKERGFVAIRFFRPGPDVFGEDGEASWQAAIRLGVPICLSSSGTDLAGLRSVLERHPDLQVHVDSFLAPQIDDGPPFEKATDFFAMSELPNLYLKLTTSNLDRWGPLPFVQEFLERAFDQFGADHLMWGSNFPSAYGADAENPYREVIDKAKDALAFLDRSSAETFWAGTARSVYPGLKR